jgi:glycosidase
MWWRDGVLYQVYPRSFADTDGDGVGDLRGIVEHLDHLAWLGVDGLWLNPTFPSPNADWGFDVSDYRGVHPELGTLEDLDELVARAGERGIRVLLDLVPNHTSDEHPWFRERRDFYVWREGRDGGPPNNWLSVFGGPAWTRDDTTGLWYLHNFDPKQPDLDWWNEAVREEFDDIIRFWLDRGIAGFRIDVAHGIVKDRELRDNPEATEDDIAHFQRLGQRPVFSMNRPEVHDVLRRWRTVADPYDAVLIGETYVHDVETLVRFYGNGVDELHLAFNFVFLLAEFGVATLAPIVAETEAKLPAHAWPVWTLGNHDLTRFATRWAQEDPGRSPRGPPRPGQPGARRRADADAVERGPWAGVHGGRGRAVAAVRRRRGRVGRGAARGSRLGAVARARPGGAAAGGGGPADGGVRGGAGRRRRLGVPARRRLPGGAEPRLRCDERRGARDDRAGDGPGARRRACRRDARLASPRGGGGADRAVRA